MTTVAFLVVIASLVALLVVGIEDIGSGHVAFANRGISVQTDTNQDQGCEPAGGTSGITNACTAISTSGPTQTQVTLTFGGCAFINGMLTGCSPALDCNNIGCTSVSCPTSNPLGTFNCVTNNGVELTSCAFVPPNSITTTLSCTLNEPGTGASSSGGVIGGDAG